MGSRYVGVIGFIFAVVVMGLGVRAGELGHMGCLLEDLLTVSCMEKVDVQEIGRLHKEKSGLLCPFFIRLLEKAQESGQRDEQLVQKLSQKSEKLCQMAIEVNPQNSILLYGLELVRGQFIRALQAEYTAFFSQPFGHEVKFKQMLDRNKRYLKQTQKSDFASVLEQTNEAIRYYYQGNTQQALRLLEKLVNKQSEELDNIRLYLFFLQIRIMQKNGQYPDALTLITSALKQQSAAPHWYLYHLQGNLLMHHLKFREAIHAFEQAMTARGSLFGFSLYNIGLCYQKMGKYQSSIQYLKKIVQYKSDSADVLNSLGFSYYSLISQQNTDKQNKYNAKHAELYYQKSLSTDPNYYIAAYNLAILKYSLGQYKEAAELFRKSIAINSDGANVSARYGLFKALYKMSKREGLRFLGQELEGRDGIGLGDLGAVLGELGEKEMAREYLQRAIQEKANLGEIYERKGLIEFEMKLEKEAIQSFKKAIENGNKKSTVWFNLAYLSQQAGHTDEALLYYQKAAEGDPNGPARGLLQDLKSRLAQKKAKQSSQL